MRPSSFHPQLTNSGLLMPAIRAELRVPPCRGMSTGGRQRHLPIAQHCRRRYGVVQYDGGRQLCRCSAAWPRDNRTNKLPAPRECRMIEDPLALVPEARVDRPYWMSSGRHVSNARGCGCGWHCRDDGVMLPFLSQTVVVFHAVYQLRASAGTSTSVGRWPNFRQVVFYPAADFSRFVKFALRTLMILS